MACKRKSDVLGVADPKPSKAHKAMFSKGGGKAIQKGAYQQPRAQLVSELAATQAGKDRSTHNLTTPLLRLPPELRKRIWDLAWPKTGSPIHVFGADRLYVQDQKRHRKLFRSVCPVGGPLISTSAKEDSEPLHLHYHDACIKKHFRTLSGTTDWLQLNFLRTCRAIHNELCLVPFTDSPFIFHDILDLEALIRQVAPEQTGAIKTLVFFFHPFHGGKDFSHKLVAAFPAVRKLSIIVELSSREDALHFVNNTNSDEELLDGSRTLASASLLNFQGLPLEKVEIVAREARSFNTGVAPERYAKWSNAMAARLLRMPDAPAVNLGKHGKRLKRVVNAVLGVAEDDVEKTVREQANAA